MIKPPALELPAESQSLLDELQREVDALPSFAARVEAGEAHWNRGKRRKGFDAVHDTLAAMLPGEDRCMYCEDSAAHEIDHLRPKCLYPDFLFRWMNYLFVCGPCNGRKKDRFGVLSRAGRRFVEVVRAPDAAVAPPEGRMMLLDPRREDPLRFLILDLSFPFHFYPRNERGCLARARAAYTIDVLGLNRDRLPRRRARAYGAYLDGLRAYVEEPDSSARERRRDALRRADHPTVWREMQRQHQRLPELRRLFGEAPEALAW